jgi:hypothetical protein
VSECLPACMCMGAGARARGVFLRACSLTYQACNAHATYCLRPLCFHLNSPLCLINDTFFGKKLLNITRVF